MLQRLRIKTLLAAMAAVGILMALAIGGVVVGKEYARWQASSQAAGALELLLKTSAFVHQIQIERGLSTGYLAGANSPEQLKHQRAASEQALQTLDGAVRAGEGAGAAAFAALLRRSEGLQALRAQVDARAFSGAECAAAYTQFITHAVKTAAGAIQSTAADEPRLFGAIQSYLALEWAKEYTGRERAQTNAILGKKSMSDAERDRLMATRALSGNALEGIQAHAPQTWQRVAQGTEAPLAAVRRYRERVDQGDFAPAGEWFAAVTAYMEALWGVMGGEAATLGKAAAAYATEARNTLAATAAGIALGGFVLVLISLYVTRRIVGQLGGEPHEVAEVARQIAAGNLGTPITLRPGDSASLMASMQAMQAALSGLVRDIRELVEKAANEGDFSRRIDLADKAGFGRDIATALNRLAATTETGLTDVMRVAHALAGGDLSQRIEQDFPGLFGRTGHAINATVAALTQAVADLQRVAEAAALRGDFAQRIETAGKQGYVRTLAELLNRLAQTTEEGLADVMRVAQALKDGDLTEKIDRDYPGAFGALATGVNATVDQLTHLVTQIQTACGTINIAADEISAGNQDLSARTEQQASSLEETAASLEELTGTVKQNADTARTATGMAGDAAAKAAAGGAVVNASAETIRHIAQASSKIADIIGVIDGIAFQTNILALNAAVEAARAGDQGRGFAVVATEVRNLAKRSADAAKEIKTLIENSLTRIEEGVAQAGDAGLAMANVVTAVEDLAHLIGNISAASIEQSSGIEQINLAVTQMDEVTQQNAALVEEAAAAAENLQDQARQLGEAVAAFRVGGTPRRSGRPQEMPAAPRGSRPPRPALLPAPSQALEA